MAKGTAQFAVTLPFGPDAARVARTLVGKLLTEHECDDQLVEDARLVAHELVMNGVRHGEPDDHTEIAVSCRLLARHIVISVLDHGQRGTVAVRPASAHSVDGRGLAIVEALCDRWTVNRSGGTRVEAWLSR
jgi:anti-sigma regulatory factor (Ser/Thr protein kinase)